MDIIRYIACAYCMQTLQCQNYLCNIEPCLFLSKSTTLMKMSEQLTPTYVICKAKHSDYIVLTNK